MFCRYALRTLDAPAARRFYADAIGLALPADGASQESILEAWPLHERARAMGAPAHWLGLLAVADVEATAERLVALGGERLGPTVRTREGTPFTTMRDPFGAVVGLRGHGESVRSDVIGWHHLNARDAERAWSTYSELFGWAHAATLEVPEAGGALRLFAFDKGGEPIGSMADIAGRPGVHPHWLFCFPVPNMQAAVERVRGLGGTAMGPRMLEGGRQLAACEDPQGAAFGLVQA